MTREELKKDLMSKISINNGYFSTKLFPEDYRIFGRRSFDDLIKYYEPHNISEELLLDVLMELEMGAKVCGNLRKLVFCGIESFRPISKYRADDNPTGGYIDYEDEFIKNSKYNISYMDKLYDKIQEKKLQHVKID